MCKAMLEKGYVNPIFGGCAIVRARPVDKPELSVADTMKRIVTTLLRGSSAETGGVSEQGSLSTGYVSEQGSLSTGDGADSPTRARSLELTTSGIEGREETGMQSDASSGQARMPEENEYEHVGDAVVRTVAGGNGTGPSNGDPPAAPDNYAIEIGACNSKHCVELSFTVLWVALLMMLMLLLLSPPKPVFYSALMIVGYWYGMSLVTLAPSCTARTKC